MTSRQNSTVITDELSLHDAAASGDEKKLEELKIFIKRGKFEIDFKDEDWGERTALHCASERGLVFLPFPSFLHLVSLRLILIEGVFGGVWNP